ETAAACGAAEARDEAGKRADAEAAYAKRFPACTAGYRHPARLREAAQRAQVDAKAAVAAYETIAADASVGPVLQDLAALRAGAMLVDAGSFDEARRVLEPLTGNDRTFRHTAREMLVLAAWRAGDAAAAKRCVDVIPTHVQT